MENQDIPKIVRHKQIIAGITLLAIIVYLPFSDNLLNSIFHLNDSSISIINIIVIVMWVLFIRSYSRCPKCGAKTGKGKVNLFPSKCHNCGVSFRKSV